MIVQWSICGSFGFQSMVVLLSSYKSCIIEYLHEQQYLTGLARTWIWLLNTMHIIKCMFYSAPVNGTLITPSWMWVMHTPYKLTAFRQLLDFAWGPHFFQKNPPTEISGYRSGYHSYLGYSTSILLAIFVLWQLYIPAAEVCKLSVFKTYAKHKLSHDQSEE